MRSATLSRVEVKEGRRVLAAGDEARNINRSPNCRCGSYTTSPLETTNRETDKNTFPVHHSVAELSITVVC